jgi:hypothetical protein
MMWVDHCVPGAMQHVVLLRRTGTVKDTGVRYGPGSAAHRAAECGALHCVRGTLPTARYLPRSCGTCGTNSSLPEIEFGTS